MEPHLTAALAGLHGHNVPVSYTNIFLMNLTSGLLLGQALGDGAATQKAEQQFDAWFDYTRRNGIHEFDSPTYYAVDLDSLVEGFRYAAKPEDRRKFEQALDYLWTDIAASFLPSAHRLVGPYSRDYDFLRGRGGMDVWLTEAGWASISSKSLDFEKTYVLDNARSGGYRPKAATAALSRKLPREVISSWDDNPRHARFLWMDRGIALGCTSGDYNAQDKLFNVTFAGSPDLPQISIEPDIFDAPYGLVKNPDRTGHLKPTHLPLHAACVEHSGIALFTLDLDPSAAPADAKGFATNLLLPAEAERTAPREIGDTITVAVGESVVSLRLIHVDSLPEAKPSIAILSDPEGLRHHAVRLKISHLPDGAHTQSKHLRVALLAVVGSDAAQAKVSSEIRDGQWIVKASLPGTALELARSASDRKMITAQSVNGQAVAAGILSIDGRDLATNLLQAH
jgi:hypothetical protein